MSQSSVKSERLSLFPNPKLVSGKATFTSELLAVEAGVSAGIVSHARTKLGVSAFKRGARLSEEAIRELGSMPDNQFAQKYDTTPAIVLNLRRFHGIPSHQELSRPPLTDSIEVLLGTMSDARLARQISGYSQYVIGYYRNKLGIPRYRVK